MSVCQLNKRDHLPCKLNSFAMLGCEIAVALDLPGVACLTISDLTLSGRLGLQVSHVKWVRVLLCAPFLCGWCKLAFLVSSARWESEPCRGLLHS